LKYLALGDSYTIGEGVAPADRWPNRLAAALQLPEPEIIARTGWTTDELDAAIDDADPRGPFDLVTLLIGVNDQYRGDRAGDYRPKFVRLLQRAILFAGNDPRRVVVVSIPDWGVTPFAVGRDRASIASQIDCFNAINREESLRARARYADVTAISRRGASLVVDDHLHPSAAMYEQWFSRILPEARAALTGGSEDSDVS
jgi:lysophospholipase L1-like esterase